MTEAIPDLTAIPPDVKARLHVHNAAEATAIEMYTGARPIAEGHNENHRRYTWVFANSKELHMWFMARRELHRWNNDSAAKAKSRAAT